MWTNIVNEHALRNVIESLQALQTMVQKQIQNPISDWLKSIKFVKFFLLYHMDYQKNILNLS